MSSTFTKVFVQFFTGSKNSFLQFIYPPFCALCNTPLQEKHLFLCKECFLDLGLVNKDAHCHRCFAEKTAHHSCQITSMHGLFACLYGGMEGEKLLQKSPEMASALLLYQWSLLSWPLPDCILITPGNPHIDKGYLVRQKLAENLSFLWTIPYKNIFFIKQSLLHAPYAPLEHQTKIPSEEPFFLTKPASVVNKKILLLHDNSSSQIAIHSSAKALYAYGAYQVYGLSAIF